MNASLQLHRLVERIKSIAQTGLTYTEQGYDRERYEQLAQVAESLACELTESSVQDLHKHWIAEAGYATPKVDVRAAVFKGNAILMCKETSDGRWSLPGGWADVGESPAGNAVKETLEESGYTVQATKLIACFDRDKQGHTHSLTHAYKLFFLCTLQGGAARTSIETSAVDFFTLDNLPELSVPRVTREQIAMCFRHEADASLPTEFD